MVPDTEEVKNTAGRVGLQHPSVSGVLLYLHVHVDVDECHMVCVCVCVL